MASNPGARRTDAQRIADLEEQLRRERIGRRGHTETKTFIIGGEISTPLYIPEFEIGVDSDGDTPEFKRIIGFRGRLRVGTCTISWLLNESLLQEGHDITAVKNEFAIDLTDTPYAVQEGDDIRPTITAADGAVDLRATVVFATAPR